MKVIGLTVEEPLGRRRDHILDRSPVWIGGASDSDVAIPGLASKTASIEFDDHQIWFTLARPSRDIRVDDETPVVGERLRLSATTRIRVNGDIQIILKHQTYANAMADLFGPSSPVPIMKAVDAKRSDDARRFAGKLAPRFNGPARSATCHELVSPPGRHLSERAPRDGAGIEVLGEAIRIGEGEGASVLAAAE